MIIVADAVASSGIFVKREQAAMPPGHWLPVTSVGLVAFDTGADNLSAALVWEAVVKHAHLPMLHRDPFDRILIAQALQHAMTLLTVDETVRAYPVPTFGMSGG